MKYRVTYPGLIGTHFTVEARDAEEATEIVAAHISHPIQEITATPITESPSTRRPLRRDAN